MVGGHFNKLLNLELYHCPISGNSQKLSVAEPESVGFQYWSSYRGKASSEIMARGSCAGNWSDMKGTE
jgi:hypothetical protein